MFYKNINKLIDVLVIFAKNNQQLEKFRINKLLYFVDKFHLQKYGRDVMGDVYKKLPKGPIADNTTNLLKAFENNLKYNFINKDIEELIKYFVLKKIDNNYELILKKSSGLSFLSSSEKEIIEDVLQKFGKKSTQELIDITHKHKAWKLNKLSKIINKEMFLEGLTPEDTEYILGLMEVDKQARSFSKELVKC
jgi:uncharacterized phage-associated protein